MSSIINYAKKVVTPSQKLQQKKQRIVKKVCGLISQNIKISILNINDEEPWKLKNNKEKISRKI
jgi:uncharacterized alkaline shock family protein YloU